MTTTQTHTVQSRAEAEAYLRSEGFKPVKAVLWVRGDQRATAFINEYNAEGVHIVTRVRV